ncbi:MAG: DEAD/DEAH box helicase family protein, partial [Candidatus Odinarchaeota archaeon]|nr:DEAD/DEAH box helicase family protein [Candidatus Odinarchaeota archaeon]
MASYLFLEKKIGDLTLEEVLTEIETLESARINEGNYEFYLNDENLKAISIELGITTDELKRSLEMLADGGFILKLIDAEGKVVGYRSRTAELVRLLYHLKQRFPRQEEAPELVEEVKWYVKPRYGLEGTIDVERFVQELITLIENELNLRVGNREELVRAYKEWLNKMGIKKLYQYQRDGGIKILEKLIKAFKTSKDSNTSLKLGNVIVAETGLGKTETYMIPALLFTSYLKILRECTNVIVIFPRYSLSINQLERYIISLYYLNNSLNSHGYNIQILSGIDNHAIPFSKRRLSESEYGYGFKNYWEIQPEKLIFKPLLCPICKKEIYVPREEGKKEVLCENNHILPVRLFKYDVYAGSQVDVVLTTIDAISVKLTWGYFHEYIKRSHLTLIVIDEIHLLKELYGSRAVRILGRLDSFLKKEKVGRVYVGLSATIAAPDYFFGEVTGMQIKSEDIISPSEEEYIRRSVSHYIFVRPARIAYLSREDESEQRFVRPLSTMIQTIMATMHNMYRNNKKFKGILFTDSIDIIERLEHDITDAEFQGLFKLRSKSYNEKEGEKCHICEKYRGALIHCNRFREGECWWFMSFDKSFSYLKPLRVRVHYADRRESLDGDIILATSALEVGYDDPTFIAMLHYGAPNSIEEFIQRKGRVGRNLKDRPLIILVTMPNRLMDNLYFAYPDYLLSGELTIPNISPNNYYVIRDAVRATILDQMAYMNIFSRDEHALRRVKNQVIRELFYRESEVERYSLQEAKHIVPGFNENILKNIIK